MEFIEYVAVDGVEALEAALERVREAQKVFATFTQEQVDNIFRAASIAANKLRIDLAEMAVKETGMGIVEDKVIKNHYASEYIYNKYRNTKTCGIIEEDRAFRIKKIAEPVGIIGAVIPTTNPTSTAIFKKRHYYISAPESKGMHYSRCKGCFRGCCGSRCTRKYYFVDRCSEP